MSPVVPISGETVVATAADSIASQESTIKEDQNTVLSDVHPPKRSALRSIVIVAACTGTQILNVAAGAGVSMALPKIALDLKMSSDKIPWIVSAFSLSSGCLLLLFGRLADLYGRKLVWQLGAIWTIAATIGCALARTGVQLIVLRAMAGAGPAAMLPAALGILAHAFPPSRARSTAFATFSAGAPVGAAFGMVIGGVMTEYASWRGLFYFVIGLGVVVFVAGVFAIDADPKSTSGEKKEKRVDWVGAFLITAGLTLVTFALSDAASAGWKSALIISLLIIGILVVGLFIVWEIYLTRRTTFPPLMPMDIWMRDHGRFSAIQVVVFMEWACFTNLVMYAMLYYQNYAGLSPLHAMLRFLPMPVVGCICNVIVALVVGIISGAWLLAMGLFATTAAALLYALMDPSAPYWQYGFPAAIICVLGADFAFACGTLFIAKIAQPHEQSVAGAIFQTIMALGTSVGLSITTVAEVAGMNAEARRLGVTVAPDAIVTQIPPSVLLKGYRTAQLAGVAFGACGLVLVAVFLNGIGIVGTKRKHKSEPPVETEYEKDEKVGETNSPA